ncbi:MAG TPA: aldose epimerase family protein [Polyangiaceae bacterium]|nr:aldose epimerase family protein [Polyangiaceae bacterium]
MQKVRRLGLAFGLLGACSASPPPPAESANEAPAPRVAPAASATTAPSTAPATAAVKPAPAVSKADWGTVDGKTVQLYTLTNKNGLQMKVSNYGTIITELHVPDRNGKLADIVLGYDTVDEYLKATPYFGATVGRIANRIKNAEFKLDGKAYKLYANNGPHNLHGGKKGWDKVIWDAETRETAQGPEIHFKYTSKDGEEGFPGTVNASVVYALTDKNEFVVTMEATTDKPTIVNMAHHTYWNLGGQGSGTIKDHELTIFADQFTPSAPVPNGDPVPDGTVKPVKGTPYDFTVAKPIGKDLEAVGGKPIGFDHNWIVNGEPNKLRPNARVKDPKSGRVLTLEADQPGIQFYSGKFLDGSNKGKGSTYNQYDGFCLETQKFPNAINVPAWKDQVLLKPGQTYKHVMVHRFSVE